MSYIRGCQECKQRSEERSLNKYNIHSGLAIHDKNGMVDAVYTYTFVYQVPDVSVSSVIHVSYMFSFDTNWISTHLIGIGLLSTSVLIEYSENLWKNICVPCTQMELTDGNRGLLI
uniref:Uncharacterized protein n=1 Tax=Trichobilharzia regenti TaxID=157069 RepID=A0AA85JZV9_TRIRE|nr:unnamed protein product [Trichobilharzia regenti]